MTCQEVVELVTSYLEGTMSSDERARFEEHLVLCDGCDRYVHQIRRTIELIGQADEQSLSPTTRNRLLDAFADWNRPGA